MGTVSVSSLIMSACAKVSLDFLNYLKCAVAATQAAEQFWSAQTSASDSDRAPRSQDTAEHNAVDLLFAEVVAEEDRKLGKLPHARARMAAISTLLKGALFAALTRSLLGINFLQWWMWPQVCLQASQSACQHLAASTWSALHAMKVE